MKIATLFGVGLVGLVMVGCASTQTAPSPEPTEPAATAPAPVAAEPAPAPEPMAADDSYTVVRGDHLWGISAMSSIYGDPYQWPLIYRANRDRIEDADLIHPGQVLTIRRGASSADVDAAVRHARTRGAWSLGVVEDSDRAYLDGSRFAHR
ncbi:peptidoglycan-binding protein [Sulfurifustis variabilis]|uniref:Peptidoglycan-binding protein n=1 Tax=Sulfurifustis variabilis TaxID=1675686 RepID=A0A1B4V660_9GAMM|nr:LysM peptidoglycan-binding domain-containing protein [Sulfurifustis variabilis]BAU49043.1 peptidoglycan-binding protein [Sulfurifustis variabilis]